MFNGYLKIWVRCCVMTQAAAIQDGRILIIRAKETQYFLILFW